MFALVSCCVVGELNPLDEEMEGGKYAAARRPGSAEPTHDIDGLPWRHMAFLGGLNPLDTTRGQLPNAR